jgi:hypothetical protein
MAQAYRLLRAASRLGVPGSLPAPPELLPASARVLAQGYLNRFSLPLLGGWLLPNWMREQTDPDCEWFVPRSVVNLMANQTRRNWTALGLPGRDHPLESIVDRWGLLTPSPGGPSLDWWVEVDGGEAGRMAPGSQREVLQSLQGGVPVVVTSYEADGLRVVSEAWLMHAEGSDWAAMQVVLFNIADMPLQGKFSFALRPYNPEGIAPIYDIAYDEANKTLVADGHAGPYTWPAPDGWALSGIAGGDLFTLGDEGRRTKDEGQRTGLGAPAITHLHDIRGFAHGTLDFRFEIEPWEEAEFLAFMPVIGRRAALERSQRVEGRRQQGITYHVPSITPNPQFYGRMKATTGLQWRELLGGAGRMKIEVPHRELQNSWDANRAHLLALHDGPIITPGPDLYHNFWLRDGAYMTYALSACGFREQAAELLRGFVRVQRRDGAFVSHQGEWDGTGQALWCMAQHLALHHDPALARELRPYVSRGGQWISETLARSAGGLMPPGVSSEHLGPPDRYYWDSIWALSGLRSAEALTRNPAFGRAAVRLRNRLATAWATDMAALGREALVGAPGRGIDLGMIGTLVAWFPLDLVPADSPLLEGTLAALAESLFYREVLLVNTGHSGWGTYLNMRLAGCRLLQGSPKGWDMMTWLLAHASPTCNWPEAIHPKSGGGSAGDGHHGWASAEWLMLVRQVLLSESEESITLAPGLPPEWLRTAGEIRVEEAPTRFGPLSYRIEWEDEGSNLRAQAGRDKLKTGTTLLWRDPLTGEIETLP